MVRSGSAKSGGEEEGQENRHKSSTSEKRFAHFDEMGQQDKEWGCDYD